jgi:alpha-beta hydrolase superfamily lysophospholipase
MGSPSAVLLLTGAWHVPEHYHKVVAQLETDGVGVLCPRLPTNNNVVPPNKTIGDDVAFIRDIIAKEAAAGTHLLVVAHSYGGIIASAALADFTIMGAQEPAECLRCCSCALLFPRRTSR